MTSASSLTNGPAGQRVRVEGILSTVSAGDGRFLLQGPDGRTVAGRLVGRSPTGLARLLGRAVLVFGIGRPGEVEADGFMPNDGQAWVVSPDDLPFSDEVARELAARQRAVRGRWPGDETEEQIERALRDHS